MRIQERFEQLEARERTLVMIFGAVLAALIFLVVPLVVTGTLSGMRDDNEQLREAIQAVYDGHEDIALRKAENQSIDARYKSPAPALAGFLSKLAQKNDIDIKSSQDRPSVPHGTDYEERSTKLDLEKTGMYNIAKFMESIERAGYPLSISRISLTKSQVDSYRVNMTVAAYHRTEASKKKKSPAASDEDEDEE
ncbi:MAG: hypothetical protein HRU17_07305 [Polyangiaceae bacterium]|nr:hypothetical protein [Polyangiaceae bacterium]